MIAFQVILIEFQDPDKSAALARYVYVSLLPWRFYEMWVRSQNPVFFKTYRDCFSNGFLN